MRYIYPFNGRPKKYRYPKYHYITNKHYFCTKNKAYGHKQQTNTVAIS